MHHLSYRAYKHRLKLVLVFSGVIAIVGGIIYLSLHTAKQPAPKPSAAVNSVVTENETTYKSSYFQFTDTQKWVLDKTSSTPTKYSYVAYQGQVIEGSLVIYINQQPTPFELAASRVLPIRIVNNNSFQVTGVSQACGAEYGQGAPLVDKVITINGAGMFCEPDTKLYTVVVSEIDGDYHLNLTRANGTPIQLIITYENQDLTPTPDSILNIASSFQVL